MRKIEIILLFLCVGVGLTFAQNNTSSPYSRFGYGELNDNVPGAYRAMGGVGIGMRNSTVINPAQPASYSVVDSTTFMFDLAASVMWSNYNDASGVRNKANGNLEYLTLQFPIWRWIGFSVGITPYSMVGYDFSLSDSIRSAYHATETYSGQGGITQVYGGLSFNIMNWVALGANVYYMFGKTTTTRSLVYEESALASVVQTSTLHVSDVRVRAGVQLFHTFADNHSVVLGAVFEPKLKLRGDFEQIESVSADTVNTSSLDCEKPMMYGVGLSYNYAGRLTIGADYQMYEWSKTRYMGKVNGLKDRWKASLGAQYIHDPLGKKFIDHMVWRLGTSVSESYITNINTKDFSVSLGFGFPLPKSATLINFTVEYGHRGEFNSIHGASAGALEENYMRFTLNASVSEFWFFKRKL